MTDIRKVQRENILRNIFQAGFRRRKDDGLDWRVLVTDKETRKILSNLFTCDEIFCQNIVRIDDLDDEKRNPVGCFAIYFLSSKGEPEEIFLSLVRDFRGKYNAEDYSRDRLVKGALDCLKVKNGCGLLEDLKQDDPANELVEEVLIDEFSQYKKNRGGVVFFTGPEINFKMCEQFQESNAANFLSQQVNFFHPSWCPFSKSVFLLDNPEEETEAIADVLNKVCKEICSSSLPDVHFQKGSSKSYNLATTLQNKMENLENRQGRSIIFIIDRGVDMVTPFMHDIILEPLCYDILQLDSERNEFPKTVIDGEFQFNLQKSKDVLWEKIRNIAFFKVYEVLESKELISAMKNQTVVKREILKRLDLLQFADDLQLKWASIFTNNGLDSKQLTKFQLSVSGQLSRLRKAKLENEFPKQSEFVQKLLDKVDKFKDIIDLIKLSMSKPTQPDIKDNPENIQEWVGRLSETISDFIKFTETVQTEQRDIDQEIKQLLETTQKLPNLLRSKKLLGLYQTMLLDTYKVMGERELKQCVDIEEGLTSENMSPSFFMDDDRLKKIKQDLTAFLSNPDHHVEDKIRLLLIFLAKHNLTEGEILKVMENSNIPQEKLRIILNTENMFHVDLVDREGERSKVSNSTSIWPLKGTVDKDAAQVGWNPFLKLLAEDTLKNSKNADHIGALELFESVLDVGKLRRVDSLNFQDVKNVIFFMTGFITHTEISKMRSLDSVDSVDRRTEGCKFYLGSTRIHTARSLIDMLDT
eukprot:GFUD01014058.1.p1 GENE.GFUD01014058.1~~GFUD01014058.1.p1  ORF type:complete len:754 (+),score=222.43 GFUD01014058.1:130-2391(+)